MARKYKYEKANYETVLMPVDAPDEFYAVIYRKYNVISLYIRAYPEDACYLVDQVDLSEMDEDIDPEKYLDEFVEKIESGKYERYYGYDVSDAIYESREYVYNTVPVQFLDDGFGYRMPDDELFE